MKELIDIDPMTGERTYFEVTPDGEFIVDEIDHHMTNAVLERNKQMEGYGIGKDMKLAASIPPQVQYEWVSKYGIEFWNPAHKDGVKRLLNSNEYRYLRINHFMM